MDVVNEKHGDFEKRLDRIERFVKTKHIIEASEEEEKGQEEEDKENQEEENSSSNNDGRDANHSSQKIPR